LPAGLLHFKLCNNQNKKKTMKQHPNNTNIENLQGLAKAIQDTNTYFTNKAQQQVNTALTIRNWLIGLYMVEYEQSGKDRADYGTGLYKALAERLLQNGLKSIRERHLYLCKDLYLAYPNILRTPSAKLYLTDFQQLPNLRTLSAKLDAGEPSAGQDNLLTRLSFSHFIELLKAEAGAKRQFYEVEAIRNNWGVRTLKRAMDSLLFERTGLSSKKEQVQLQFEKEEPTEPEAVFRNTYLLEFLGLEEKAAYTENDLEERIITNLQQFLLELGRGFCFEQRQKRITFDNRHYRIDLVFYHRILKCHVLLDLKIGEFDHGDAGQMNMYLNYYKENESHNRDNPPIGIILCSGKNEALVKYATMGLPQQVFVSKYLVNLPSEKELQQIVEG
jgi:predicted nuclease of restriction endonuclease-like (RecB) superfamily